MQVSATGFLLFFLFFFKQTLYNKLPWLANSISWLYHNSTICYVNVLADSWGCLYSIRAPIFVKVENFLWSTCLRMHKEGHISKSLVASFFKQPLCTMLMRTLSCWASCWVATFANKGGDWACVRIWTVTFLDKWALCPKSLYLYQNTKTTA